MRAGKSKIVMLISNNNPGGVFISTGLLNKHINRDKFHIIAVACGPGPMADQLGEMADEYYNLNVGTFPRLRKMKGGEYKEDLCSWLSLLLWLLRSIWSFTLWLYKNDVDLIHSNGTHFNIIAGFAARLARVPSVWHVRFPQNTGSSRNFLVRLAEGPLAALLPTRIIANSNFTASTFHNAWKKKTVVIWNGIDAKFIAANQHPDQLRQMAKVSKGEKLVGITGLITRRKGMDRFIRMAFELAADRSDVKFVIVGGAPQKMEEIVKAELEELTKNLGLSEKLCFTGNLDNAPCYMGDMDVFFMCSRPGTETFGLVVIEAMAAGVPVVGFNNDAIPEIIEDGKTGFIVPDGDITLVKDRILEILANPELADSIRKNGKERVFKEFDFSILVANIERLYTEILK